MLTPADTKKLMDAAGGKLEFAKLLGFADHDYRKQRLWNWLDRGLSRKAVVENYSILAPLAEKAKVKLL